MDLQEKEQTLAHLVLQVNQLKSEKKEVMKDYKEQIDGKEAQIASLAQEIDFTKPKVVSSLIGFYPLKKSYGIFIGNKSLEQFDIFLQSAFKQPRKKLLNNLKRYRFKEEQREKIMELLERRAQHTSLEDFYLLFSNILSS